MKFTSPQSIGIVLGLIAAVITCTFSFLGFIIAEENFYKYLIVEFLAVFLISYILIYLFVRNVLINKVKPIYKIIRSNKILTPNNIEDITEKNIVAEVEKEVAKWAVNKSKEIDNLKKMEKYRKEFLGNVSHELKTPIFNIQGYVSTLLDGGLDDPLINKKYLERAEKSVDRMISIVQDLESISRIETGELELQYENFNIVQLVKDIFEMHEMRARSKSINLVLVSNEKTILVNADKRKISDVITNLIVNSINYGKDKGKTIVEFFDMDDHLLIEVSDNGIGIEKNHLPRIFERFYRIDKSRSRDLGGTGLGLAIVKHIIEAHKQRINVRSTYGEGTSFSFTLAKAKK